MRTYIIILFISLFQSISCFSNTKVKQNISSFIVKDISLQYNIPPSSDSLDSSYTEKLEIIAESAIASYYHNKFNGRRTASGSIFNNNEYTAAHNSLPFGTKVCVTNIANQKSVILTITDRGPFKKGRGIDLSRKAFMEITDNIKKGTLNVIIEKIEKTSVAESDF